MMRRGWTLLATAGTAAAILTGCATDAGDAAAPLGATVSPAEDSPTGYEATFRLDAPDADQVWLAGDLYYAAAEDIEIAGNRRRCWPMTSSCRPMQTTG